VITLKSVTASDPVPRDEHSDITARSVEMPPGIEVHLLGPSERRSIC
jgi:hypothetical protein